MLNIGMEDLYFDTQESELELVGCMGLIKAPWKDKNPRCIVDYVHWNFMATSYNHHFMLYSWDKNNVMQLILNHAWKVVYKDHKK